MHLRILDCMPPPQDLVHALYAPQAVHLPSADSVAANDETLPAENVKSALIDNVVH